MSCDSLMRHRFAEMTRRDALDRVFTGIRAAEAAGLTPIKINCVVIGGTNDDEVVDFARWSRQTGFEVRFIEYMPLDAERKWERDKVVPSASILERIHDVFALEAEMQGNEPATRFRFADGSPGGVGVIASVTEPFCDTCNRLRLTSEGMLRSCLFALEETNLRDPLRAGAGDEELAALVRRGENESTFIISQDSEKGLMLSHGARALAQLVGGPVLTLGGLGYWLFTLSSGRRPW